MSEIFIYRGNLVNVEADCIVCPANSSLMPGAGVNRVVFYAAGDDLYNYCQNLEKVEPGKAVTTPGFNIPVKYIIHTVGPYWHGGYEGEAKILASCYIECMKKAVELGMKSIAFPALSTGNGKYPIREAAEIAVYSVKSFLQNHPDVNMDVYMMCFTDDALIKFRNANMATNMDIVKYLKRKDIKITDMELTKDEVSLAKKKLFKKERTKEQTDKTVYAVLRRIAKKRKNLIVLGSKMTKDRITAKTCDAHDGRTGPYITLDTVENIEIKEIKKGLFMVPTTISFVVRPYAYTKEDPAVVQEQQEAELRAKIASGEIEAPEEVKMVNIEEELLNF